MITDGLWRRRRRWGLSAAGVGIWLMAAPVVAHNVEPRAVRELVRIQGFRAPAPQGVEVAREMAVVVLGRQLRFAVTDWRVFVFAESPNAPPPPEPPQVILQGDRALLHGISTARTDQQITVLAEHRPGSSDLSY